MRHEKLSKLREKMLEQTEDYLTFHLRRTAGKSQPHPRTRQKGWHAFEASSESRFSPTRDVDPPRGGTRIKSPRV